MAKTTNLGLNLTTDDSTEFEAWRKSIDGNGSGNDKSNMQIIDEFAGNAIGRSGTFTLLSSNWANSTQTISIPTLGANDLLNIVGASVADQDKLDAAQLFGASVAGSVTFTAKNTPTSNIAVKYFITRGVA